MIRGVFIKDQRRESAQTPDAIVQNFGTGRAEPVIATIPVDAAKIGEPLAVIAEIDLVVGLMERSEGCIHFHFAIALKARARNHVEHPVRTVAILGRITTALHFQVIDVLWIDLRPNVARDVRIRNRNSVDRPSDLMPAANV